MDHTRNEKPSRNGDYARKVRIMNLVKVSVLCLLLFAAPEAEAASVTMLYNASVRAELHDCGCRKLPLGGLARRAALIDDIASGDRELLLVDAGNLMGDPTQDTLAQSIFVATQTAAIGYSAVGVGSFEFGHGIEAIREVALASGLEFLSANLVADGEHPFAPWTVIERGGVRFGLISVVDPGYDRAPYNERVDALHIEDPVIALQRELPRLRENCDLVVLLSNMETSAGTVDLLRAVETGSGIELVVEGAVSRHYDQPVQIDETLILASNARGKYLGQLDLVIDDGSVKSAEGEIHMLRLELREQKQMAARVSEFEAGQEAVVRSR
jgi:2',3'-cyclic-nucleotide 2'-phosphodiesterase (5'-nucleotidase family)